MKRLLSLSVCLMITLLSFAHDFEVDGIYYNITSSTAPYTVEVTDGYDQYTGAVTIPKSVTYNGKTYSVTSIGRSAFYGCSSLTSVAIPNSMTSIEYHAFDGCSSLTTVNINSNAILSKDYSKEYSTVNDIFGTQVLNYIIGNDVTSIGRYAFFECRELKSVSIGNSVTSIGDCAFEGCSGLTSINIPNSVTSIGADPFGGTAWFNNQPNGLVYVGKVAYKYKGRMPANTTIVLKEGTTEISGGAFYECTGLTFITITNSVTSIGGNAFYNCGSLKSITIPNSVTSIGIKAFSGCFNLTSITIPNSVTSIGIEAFSGCTGLTSVTMGNSVTSIGMQAFYNCYRLRKVIISDMAAWCNISFSGIFSNPCSGSGAYIFSDENTKITDLVIPNSVTSIGEYAFACCSDLTSVTIPNSVTSIGVHAFAYCRDLTSVTIPSSVTSIGNYAFEYCSGLKEITSYIQEPFAINDGCWYGVNKSIPLYVPVDTKEKYQSTGGWKDFTNIIEFGGGRIEPATEPKEVDMAAVPDQMNLNGMVVGDTYYVLDADNGDGADSENGCVVIITTTNDEAVNGIAGKDISDASVKAVFKGIIFMVPAGTGKVSVTGQTVGSSSLMVKVGSQPAQAFQLAERETVQIPYTVTEPTYVYIYAGTSAQGARAQGATTAAAAENSVKVYSYKWEPTEPTGINSIHNSQFTIENEAGAWYTLDGRKLSGKPAQKGIYIHNGKKVAVK